AFWRREMLASRVTRIARKSALSAAISAAGVLSFSSHALATTWTWIGAAGSANTPTTGSWNTSRNWLKGSVPWRSTRDGLLFGGGGGIAYTSTNNMASLQMGTLTLSSTAPVQETIATTGNGIANTSGSGATFTIEQKNTGLFSIALPIQIKNNPLILTSA